MTSKKAPTGLPGGGLLVSAKPALTVGGTWTKNVGTVTEKHDTPTH